MFPKCSKAPVPSPRRFRGNRRGTDCARGKYLKSKSGGAFCLRCRETVVFFRLSSRLTGFACLICLFVLGCATHAPTTNANMWRIQKERQQRVAREFGRIGYIGNSGPAVGGGFP
jgi:hypothetical protein